MTQAVRRPVMRWHGGKWRLASWILQYMPEHRVYVEPFGGAGSVLLRKPRAYAEVFNDLDGEAVNVFRVLRDPGAAERLRQALELTPFAREEFAESYLPAADPVEQARRTIARSFMGFGSSAMNASRPTGFRANSNRSRTTPAHDWRTYPESIAAYVERLRGVVIENRPAVDVMAQHDAPDAVHYVDPPYLHGTRGKRQVGNYRHEMTDQEHADLAHFLGHLRGAVLVSGYDSPLYRELFADWHLVAKEALADGARPRLECLWIKGPKP